MVARSRLVSRERHSAKRLTAKRRNISRFLDQRAGGFGLGVQSVESDQAAFQIQSLEEDSRHRNLFGLVRTARQNLPLDRRPFRLQRSCSPTGCNSPR